MAMGGRRMAGIARLGIAALAALVVAGGGAVSTPSGVSAHGGYSVHDRRVQPLFNPAIEREVLDRRDNDPLGLEGSGGHAIAHYAGGQAITSEGASVARASSRLYRTGFFAIEPTLGVTKDGTIFYQTTDARDWPAFSTDVIRSTNEGRSWKAVGPRLGSESRHPITEDPYLYVDEKTGRVFTVDFLLPCSAISYSDDKGKSWSSTLSACDLVDHQTLFAGPPVSSPTIGYRNIVYYCSAGAGLARWTLESTCLKSLDGGKTFVRTGEPAFITDPRQGMPGLECSGVHGHGFAGDDGTVYVPKGHCGKPWLAISRDEGRTWTRVQVANLDAPHHEAGVAADKQGNIYYLWISKDRLPYLVVSTDRGKTWTKPYMVAAPGVNEASLPSIAVGDKGKVAISYMGTTESPGPPFDGDYDDVTWNGYMTITVNALAQRPKFLSASVNPPSDPLIKGSCYARCGAAFDFLDVVIAPDGTPLGSFVDGCFKNACDHMGRFFGLGEATVGRLVGGPRLR